MKVVGLSYVMARAGACALVLSDERERYRVPVIVGIVEAQAISAHLEKAPSRRPLTHDLMKGMMEKLEATLVEVCIYRWEDGIYFTNMLVASPRGEFLVESRVSDAVALALCFSAPLYMSGEVLGKMALLVRDNEIVSAMGLEDEEDTPLHTLPEAELTRLMNQAVAGEDYERASRYRDELKKRKKK
jgi:bifunctional DNase/RNase